MIRRSLLKSTAALAASTALPSFATAPNQGRLYRAVKIGHKAQSEELEKIAALGFHGIEVNGGEKLTLETAAELRQRATDAGLPIHGVVGTTHWKIRLSAPSPDIRAQAVADLKANITAAHALGGSSVLLVPGAVKGATETHDDVWNRSLEGINEVLPLASKLGIHILIETVWNGFCESPEKFRDYIDAADNPWVQAYLDFGNMQKFAPAEQWFTVLGDRIVKLDIKDWGVESKFCPLGNGDVNWPAVCEAIEKINFTGWATREGSDGGLEKTAPLMDKLLQLD